MNQKDIVDIARTWKLIWNHPISSRHRASAMGRWLRWQLGSRILPGQAVVPFVAGAKLLVRRSMVGATGNVYMGLHEFEEMAFVMHLLRANELFVDIGANVGSYTILAAVQGARCIAVEPVPDTYAHMVSNVHINSFQALVSPRQVALGASTGTCEFTANLDAMNHVAVDGDEKQDRVRVELTTLDALVAPDSPMLLKVDVEGYETEVLNGAMNTLAQPNLKAIVIEMNQSGTRYGFSEAEIVTKFKRFGFEPYCYAPFERLLKKNPEVRPSANGNVIWVRDVDAVRDRLLSAPVVSVCGVDF